MGRSGPIQHNLNINNPRLSFELSALAYFRYLIKVFTLLVSVFAFGTKQTEHCVFVSRCQPWHRQHSAHGHRCHGCRPCQRSHWSLSPCHKLKSLHKCLCIFCKGQDYNLGVKTFNSVNIFMVSKSSIAAGPAFFIVSQS